MYKFYAAGHWEKRKALFVYEVAKGADGTWRISTPHLSPKLGELEKVATFVSLGSARD